MKYIVSILFFCSTLVARSQPMVVQPQPMVVQSQPMVVQPQPMNNAPHPNPDPAVIEIRSYTLKPGTRDMFHKVVVEQSMPMAKRWGFTILGYGPSLQEDSSYYLIRAYKSLEERQKLEDAFYGSDEWKKGPREAIVSKIIYYTTVIFPVDSIVNLLKKINAMTQVDTHATDSTELSVLNKQFIENFTNQDAVRHSEIISKDFVCIRGNGAIIPRDQYLKDWATGYSRDGYTSFTYTDESIRIFGNTALVRSKTVFTKNVDGKPVTGYSVYTDTYVKEDGDWKCVQAQITPLASR
jgi:ketosteroid isomerase-like protein